MTVAGALLAAGEGSRFVHSISSDESGSPDPSSAEPSWVLHKLLADFRGRPLATWAVGALLEALVEGALDQVYLVTGSVDLGPVLAWLRHNRSGLPLDELFIVHNDDWKAGQATSVGAAIDAADADGHGALVIGLADQPLVPSSAWSSVAGGAAPLVVASFDGVRRPPVKLDREVWPEVPRIGDAGARSVLRARPELVSEVPCVGNPVDIDTVKDLRAWS